MRAPGRYAPRSCAGSSSSPTGGCCRCARKAQACLHCVCARPAALLCLPMRRKLIDGGAACPEAACSLSSARRAPTRPHAARPPSSAAQYDCGKLVELDALLRRLKTGGHRVLIFTQARAHCGAALISCLFVCRRLGALRACLQCSRQRALDVCMLARPR